jgi:CRP/FNR family transcriptional regulator
MPPHSRQRLSELYPVLQGLPAGELSAVLQAEAQVLAAPAGMLLFEEGAPCRGFPLVLSGGVRVARGSPGGRTLELYRVTPGELCVVSTSCLFRRYVFGIFADRLADLMALAEAVAFQRLDQRLAQALLGHGDTLRRTHQQLADELGTVREIVSRLLSRFERAGWVALGRERITVLDGPALRRLASGQGAAAEPGSEAG